MPNMDNQKHYNLPNIKGNQKAIRTKRAAADKDNYYSKFNIECLEFALMNLTPNAFKLWAWFTKNQDGYQFALSGIEVQGACSFSKGTYDKCVKELIDKGFLRPALLYPKFRGYIFVEGGPLQGAYPEEKQLAPDLWEAAQDSTEFKEG